MTEERLWWEAYVFGIHNISNLTKPNELADKALEDFKQRFPAYKTRNDHPAVKEAWENYLTLLALHQEGSK